MRIGLFPGQGIPARVVLDALPPGDPFLEKASDLLNEDLRKRVSTCVRSSSPSLPTELAQPAIFVAGVISWSRKTKEGIGFNGFIGHSLGEYAALVAAGAVSFSHGLAAVATRAKAMQRAATGVRGGMQAILGFDLDAVKEIARAAGVSIANDNAPYQVVVAGSEEGLAAAGDLARARGGRAVRLKVQAPFHTVAMSPAEGALRDALFHTEIRSPKVPVISNVTARPYQAPGEIRRLLVHQLTHPVRFREAVTAAWNSVGRDFVDLGPGHVVGDLAAQTIPSISDEVMQRA